MSDWLQGVDTRFTYPFHDNGDDDDSDVDSLSSSRFFVIERKQCPCSASPEWGILSLPRGVRIKN